MDIQVAEEIIACLGQASTKYFYFKDRYALMLLGQYCRNREPIKAVRRSRLGRLLGKPLVREALRYCGDGRVQPEVMRNFWPEQFHCYTLSLGIWGNERKSRWYQTSRVGHNLVLQLNFSNVHDRHYRRLKIHDDSPGFGFSCHPTSRVRNTLAWSRIDLDLASDTALIEEIQSDWLREAHGVCEMAKRYLAAVKAGRKGPRWYEGFPPELAIEYFETAVAPHMAVWAEAMLAATIEFLLEEVGVRKIYFHSWETGKKVKHCSPPKSIYRALPEKFCFERVSRGPQFLYDDKSSRRKMKKIENQQWYLLDFNERSLTDEKEPAAQSRCA